MEAAAGPLTWHNHDYATGHVDGRPILLGKGYTGGSGQPKRLSNINIELDLGGRPVRLKIDETSLGRSKSDHDVMSGDAVFDDRMAVSGWPADGVRAALDGDTRRYLLDTFDKRWPYVDTRDGRLQMRRTAIYHHRKGNPLGDPAEIAETARHVQSMASRLVETYDEMHAEIHRTQGADAASAFHQEHVEKWESHKRRRAGRMVLILGVVVAIVGAFTWFSFSGMF